MTSSRGFTLIEMLVSVALFTVVMVMALGALLMVSEADRKAETLKEVINNLNFSLDSMSRAIRTGDNYYCGSGNATPGVPQDCPGENGANYLAFTASNGAFVEYLYTTCANSIGCIEQRITPEGSSPTGSFLPLTSPQVNVTGLTFYVIGSLPGNTDSCNGNPCSLQPKVTILVHGYAIVTGDATSQSQCNINGNTCAIFNLQTTVTQRVYDE